ncbi:MAG: fumarylacetoacetate hydrolase family protein [Nocardioides sp.]
MKVFSYYAADRVGLGAHTDRGAVDVAAAASASGVAVPTTVKELIHGGAEALERLRQVVGAADATMAEDSIRYAPAVPDPNKIICVGANYQRHAREARIPLPEQPIYFAKFGNSLTGHREDIAFPAVTEQVDYEVELVAVVGQPAYRVDVSDALDYVFGYATGNDLSARDLQKRTSQWIYGKALDGFAPLGPYVVTADEIPDPQALDLRCWVNGQLRQDSTTKDMVFSVADLVSDLSQVMTLEPGDVIYTGTPEGVILGMAEQTWLRPGDSVACEVSGLGRLENRLVAERSARPAASPLEQPVRTNR